MEVRGGVAGWGRLGVGGRGRPWGGGGRSSFWRPPPSWPLIDLDTTANKVKQTNLKYNSGKNERSPPDENQILTETTDSNWVTWYCRPYRLRSTSLDWLKFQALDPSGFIHCSDHFWTFLQRNWESAMQIQICALKGINSVPAAICSVLYRSY